MQLDLWLGWGGDAGDAVDAGEYFAANGRGR